MKLLRLPAMTGKKTTLSEKDLPSKGKALMAEALGNPADEASVDGTELDEHKCLCQGWLKKRAKYTTMWKWRYFRLYEHGK
jgi:hypothetical protein